MYKILGEDKVMVDKLAPERLEAEYSLVRGWKGRGGEAVVCQGYLFQANKARPRKVTVYYTSMKFSCSVVPLT
jgi:hypothetical protein